MPYEKIALTPFLVQMLADAKRATTDDPAAAVTRFEVIDHTGRVGAQGRVYAAYGVKIELSYQDDGRTLKVFVEEGTQ